MIEAGVVNLVGRYAEKKQDNMVERNKTCWLQSRDGGQRRWTVWVGVSRKNVRIVVQGNRAAGYKARTVLDKTGLFGAGMTNQN